jgi:hypothetical protein
MIPGIPTHSMFTPDGQFAAWGNADGTVSICDFPQVNRRLGEAGLGW